MSTHASPLNLSHQHGFADLAPSTLGRLVDLAHALSRWAVWGAGGLILASVLLVTLDVLLRKLMGRGVGGADELSGYAFAIGTSWSLAFATLQRAHVRVDVLYHRLPRRAAAVLDWLSLVATGVFCAYLSYYAFEVLTQSWTQGAHANSSLGTPLWVPQGLWLLGLGWMCVVLGLLLLRASAALIRGDAGTVAAIAGVRSAQEEAREGAEDGARIVQGEQS